MSVQHLGFSLMYFGKNEFGILSAYRKWRCPGVTSGVETLKADNATHHRASEEASGLAVSCVQTNFPRAATQPTPLVVQFTAFPHTAVACVRSVPFLNHRESFKVIIWFI